MNLRNKKTEENFKVTFRNFIENFKFKSLNLTFSMQLVIIGCVIGFGSLFLPWIKDVNQGFSWNAFFSITGNIGYLLLIILTLPLFVILSTNYKEKIKLYSDLSFKNHFIVITAGIFVISFSIITLSFVNGLHTFFENTVYGNGVILCMTAGFIILIGGIIIRKEYYEDNSEIILNKLNQNREKAKEEDNMKLPF